MNWKGVMPAITTSFNQDLSIDHGYVGEHCRWMIENGCSGIVARRVSSIRALLDDRVSILVGVDDAVLETIAVGATGWIAGLANALPRESVESFECGVSGERDRAFELYRWFLPLLRMDTVPKFVQLIKLVQSQLGRGNEIGKHTSELQSPMYLVCRILLYNKNLHTVLVLLFPEKHLIMLAW